MSNTFTDRVTLISSGKNWMEQAALDQLGGVSRLPGVVRAVGLPDLHPGKSPVGIAVCTRGRIYPHLIGNDIGCGMSLFSTGVPLRKFKPARWIDRLEKLQALRDVPLDRPIERDCPISDMGTIGSGNHFGEFQKVVQIFDEALFRKLQLPKDQVLLLIHSGSRGYGQQIFSRFLDGEGFEEESPQALQYLREHGNALYWARRNRELAALRLMLAVGSGEPQLQLDCPHNFLERHSEGWIHRKGASSALAGPVVIPGSRGSLTYICMPKVNTEVSLYSLAHGAGRKWKRESCQSRIGGKYTKETIRTTVLKSRVICHDTSLLFEEAPEAYKSIEGILRSLQDFDLIRVVAALQPLITWKG